MRLKQSVTKQTVNAQESLSPSSQVATVSAQVEASVTDANELYRPVGQACTETSEATTQAKLLAGLADTASLALSWMAFTFFSFITVICLFLMEMPLLLDFLWYAVAAFSLGSLLCVFPLSKVKARRYLTTVAGLLILAGITWVPNGSPRQAFLLRFHGIQTGMTLAQVRAHLGERHPLIGTTGSNAAVPQDFTGTLYVPSHTPNDESYNADVTKIHFNNERVVGKEFSPD